MEEKSFKIKRDAGPRIARNRAFAGNFVKFPAFSSDAIWVRLSVLQDFLPTSAHAGIGVSLPFLLPRSSAQNAHQSWPIDRAVADFHLLNRTHTRTPGHRREG